MMYMMLYHYALFVIDRFGWDSKLLVRQVSVHLTNAFGKSDHLQKCIFIFKSQFIDFWITARGIH